MQVQGEGFRATGVNGQDFRVSLLAGCLRSPAPSRKQACSRGNALAPTWEPLQAQKLQNAVITEYTLIKTILGILV